MGHIRAERTVESALAASDAGMSDTRRPTGISRAALREWTISVSRRAAVARLDELIGLKR